jgi:hypothetical protein
MAFESYLERIDRMSKVGLGPKEKRAANAEDSRFLTYALERELQFNKRMIILFLALLLIGFGIALFGVYYSFHSAQPASAILGAFFLFMLGILERLRRLWRDKHLMDITLLMTKELTPPEAAKTVETMYWNILRETNK